ncbi:MAG: hypothetical protein GQ574_26770 [Crocinitomix sp.]|nr:hypothetical protein [Crocinitomix sp.]
MRKILIHNETITKAGVKRLFQIVLPKNTLVCNGILIEATKTTLPTENQFIGKNRYCGWVTLQIPNERDVFFSELIPFFSSELQTYRPTLSVGLDEQKPWWFSGTKREFFSVSVPTKSMLIEGYYEDHAIGTNYPYQVRIYLEIESE